MALLLHRTWGLEVFNNVLRLITYLRELRSPPTKINSSIFRDHQHLIIDLCENRIKSLQNSRKKRPKTSEIDLLTNIAAHIPYLGFLVESVREKAPRYDIDELHPGNGYRTFVSIADTMAEKLHIALSTSNPSDETLAAFAEMIISLEKCFAHLTKLLFRNSETDLFSVENDSLDELIYLTENVNQECFYGELLGLQYDESFGSVLKIICRMMLVVGYRHYNRSKLFFRPLIKSSEFAKKMVRLSRNGDVNFIKAFWKLSDSTFMTLMMKAACPIVISRSYDIDTVIYDEFRDVAPKAKKIPLKIICSKMRRGEFLTDKERKKAVEPSPGLVIHVHGGGFVSQSAQSQEGFLRSWACKLDVPIVSIDYGLAPESKFPNALEEVFYAYRWILKYHHKLGSTGGRIVMAGDSAGANIILGVVQACIDMDIRLPDGLFLAYVPVLVSFTVSPARMLGLMDPFLPYGFMMRCIRAYAGEDPEYSHNSSRDEFRKMGPMYTNYHSVEPSDVFEPECSCKDCKNKSFLDKPHLRFNPGSLRFSIPEDRFLSPFLAPDEVLMRFPPIAMCTTTLDPCLDDTVMFTKRLRRLNKTAEVDIFEGLPHGFLNFGGGYKSISINNLAQTATNKCADRINNLLDLNSFVNFQQ